MGNKFNTIFLNLRKEKGLTQEQLGKELGITRQSVSNYEKGIREPDFITLEKIADYFNVDMNYLLGESKVRNRYQEEKQIDIDDDMIVLARNAKTLTKEQKALIRSMIDEFNKQNED